MKTDTEWIAEHEQAQRYAKKVSRIDGIGMRFPGDFPTQARQAVIDAVSVLGGFDDSFVWPETEAEARDRYVQEGELALGCRAQGEIACCG